MTGPLASPGPLDGIRVLDASDESGALAGKILGDLGADVVHVEPPGGDGKARRGPYLGDVPDPERSLAWLALHTSQRGITLDPHGAEGRALWARLVARSDVVLETARPGALDEAGLGWERARRENPRLVWCSITPFGSNGPRAAWLATDLVVVAMGGNAGVTGDPDRPPVRCTMPTAYYHAGPEAVLGILMALYAREDSGQGRHVDVSLQECQLQSLLSGVGQYARHHRLPQRSGGKMGRTREIWPARDGWVTFGLRGGRARIANLEATVQYMDECGMAPDWLKAYDWKAYNHNEIDDAEIARFEETFGAFFASRSMRELYREALARRILLAPCNDAREILEHEQLRDRKFFVTLDYPALGTSIEHPAFFARMAPHGVGVRRRAPRIGEHNAEVYGELGLDEVERKRLTEAGVL